MKKSRGRLPECIDLFEALAEGARFENPTGSETIDLDLLLSFRSQSLTVELEASKIDEKPIKYDRTR